MQENTQINIIQKLNSITAGIQDNVAKKDKGAMTTQIFLNDMNLICKINYGGRIECPYQGTMELIQLHGLGILL
jgi:hypothetical protein